MKDISEYQECCMNWWSGKHEDNRYCPWSPVVSPCNQFCCMNIHKHASPWTWKVKVTGQWWMEHVWESESMKERQWYLGAVQVPYRRVTNTCTVSIQTISKSLLCKDTMFLNLCLAPFSGLPPTYLHQSYHRKVERFVLLSHLYLPRGPLAKKTSSCSL